MKCKKTERGFGIITHEKYQNTPNVMTRLIQESSAVGEYADSGVYSGSSYLWVGQDHHLNREEVVELIHHMQYWLAHKHLKTEEE